MSIPDYPYGFHTARYAPPSAPDNELTGLPRQPTVRIYCDANKDLSVTARNGTVVLAPADSNDYYQHWIKDMTYSNDIKDKEGFPAFALVNRVTAEAIQIPVGENQRVGLVSYNPNRLDYTVKWTQTRLIGFGAIRITDTPSLNLTAVATNNKFYDGSQIVVKKWDDNAVQLWKIVPYNSNVPY